MVIKLVLISVLFGAVLSAKSEVSFNNVVIHVYSMYTYKYNVTIESSNTLKDYLKKDLPYDKIEIKDCKIPILYEESISNMNELDELILNNNSLSKLTAGAFSNVPYLRKLVITNNIELEEIREGVFNHLNIATLDLSKNGINKIVSGAFDDMPELLNINLADNQLKIWDKNWFANTPLLSRVSMQNNLIDEIPMSAFSNLRGEKKFGSVPLTVNIILSNNKIKEIHQDAFKGLDKINNLWLDGNEIDRWDENLLSGLVLKDLRIDNNKFVCLSGSLEKFFIAASTHIDGNPWDCGCLKSIDLWASQHGKDVIMFYSKLTCDAKRIEEKLKSLNERLKKLKKIDSEK